MAEYTVSFFIFCIVSIFLIGIGISQLKSKSPVGFYTGEKPPEAEQLTDVNAWNRKHGMMWIIYGIALAGSFFTGIPAGDSIYSVIITGCVALGALPVMIWYHGRLKQKYLNRNI